MGTADGMWKDVLIGGGKVGSADGSCKDGLSSREVEVGPILWKVEGWAKLMGSGRIGLAHGRWRMGSSERGGKVGGGSMGLDHDR